MSVLVSCKTCDNEWEVGLTDDADGNCRECKRTQERLENGGHPLSTEERTAVAEFLGVTFDKTGLPFLVTGGTRGMLWADDGFKDFDALTEINSFSNQVFEQ
jgi:hypothetical protein